MIVYMVGAVVLAAGVVCLASLRVLREYERAVVFRLGRLRGARGPGLLLMIPLVDRMERVSLRTITLTIPPQEVITRDNVPARVNAVAYFRVTDPVRTIVEVEAHPVATSQIAQTTLRSVLGHVDLDTLLAEREELNESIRKIVDEQTEPWGIKVTTVEIKDVEIPEAMQRAMARQAEAERERRAKVINAAGEHEAAQALHDASQILAASPSGLHLRYLQTLLELGGDQRSTVVFPLPMDLLEPFLHRLRNADTATSPPAAAPEPSDRPPTPTRYQQP
jgi:regulator of protease activity HflC (stomatin/prohibitin superfamily)